MSYRWNGRYLPDRSNKQNYGSIPEIVEENEDFAVYNVPKLNKGMGTMGSMDINSTCDDGKVLLLLKSIQNNIINIINELNENKLFYEISKVVKSLILLRYI